MLEPRLMNRSFFFIKNATTGLYYTGVYGFNGSLQEAAVYHKLENAEKQLRSIKRSTIAQATAGWEESVELLKNDLTIVEGVLSIA